MTEGNKILGKVAFVDKGDYKSATRYDFFNFVTTEDSCYLSLKDNNTGHPVTDTAWWKCLANGKQATEAAREALTRANEAAQGASLANAAAVRAGNAATKADQATGAVETIMEEALTLAVEAERMIVDGKQQIASMKAAESSLMSQALLAPSRMELTYNKVITRRNPVTQYIKARLYPAYVLQNVIFQQPVNGGDSVYVEPSGKLEVNKVGHTKIHVIPTHNTGIYQTVDIEVQEPVIRLTGDCAIRFNSDGSIRLT